MPGLRIAIDASRTTRRRRTGTENYALQLIRRMLEINNPHQFDLYFRDKPPTDLFADHPQAIQHVIPFPRLWTHVRFASELWRIQPNITFVPAHTLPRFFPGRAVVTVHDLGYVHFPEAHPEKERRYLDWSTRYSANRAAIVLADAQATKFDLIEHYGINANKIRVVYPGYDEGLVPIKDETQLATSRRKYGLPEQYLLFVGTLQPRKNIARLVQAFAQWRSASNNLEVSLVLAGQKGWLYDESWIEGVDGVIVPGYIDEADIASLYSGALALVFPSLFEGFGFPVVEAMRCETPVLCSTTSSLPELAGEAALLVDPLKVDAIADGIKQLVENAQLRRSLIERGRRQVQKFTWDNAAQQALQALEDAGR
jgi:glycosyltransferase involved in cell wall biosynthesis